ncbi:hypothetical protein D3C87_1484150 [compost metagenome]
MVRPLGKFNFKIMSHAGFKQIKHFVLDGFMRAINNIATIAFVVTTAGKRIQRGDREADKD